MRKEKEICLQIQATISACNLNDDDDDDADVFYNRIMRQQAADTLHSSQTNDDCNGMFTSYIIRTMPSQPRRNQLAHSQALCQSPSPAAFQDCLLSHQLDCLRNLGNVICC